MNLANKPATNKTFNYWLLLLAALVPVIIYFYFLPWRTATIYGDDLYIFRQYEGLKTITEKIGMPISFGKYRPLHGLSMHLIIEFFQKNIWDYYVFNVAIQAINAILFACTANLFLRSPIISLLFGFTIGLSRFAYFNIAQLLNGGALEGLAMSFFLASLFFLIKAVVTIDCLSVKKQSIIIWSIVFANLSMYTHERYIVLLLFIMLMVLLFPALKQLSSKQKAVVIIIAVASMALNVLLKKAIYNMPFFMGTASTTIQFSYVTAISFFEEAVLAIFHVNIGPEYLMGIKFTGLSFFNKLLIVVLLATILFTLVAFLKNIKSAFAAKQKKGINNFWLFISLVVLFGLCLVPAVVTIRVEQRWLQASYSIFILLCIIAYKSIPHNNFFTKKFLLPLLLLLLLWVDFNYLSNGVNKLYMADSEKTVVVFEKAVRNGTIKPNTKDVFIWESKMSQNRKNDLTWDLAEGYFFNFYQNEGKNIIYVDDNYQERNTLADSIFINFNKVSEQILAIDDTVVTDVTDAYLKGSSKYFVNEINNKVKGSIGLNQKQLLILASDMNGFSIIGFHDYENGFRWTNGNASIGFPDNYTGEDSLTIILNTYMPPVCKNVIPKINLQATNGKKYLPVYLKREGDIFTFKFYLQDSITLQKINIVSATIPSTPPDQRTLSFPFISLEIKR